MIRDQDTAGPPALPGMANEKGAQPGYGPDAGDHPYTITDYGRDASSVAAGAVAGVRAAVANASPTQKVTLGAMGLGLVLVGWSLVRR